MSNTPLNHTQLLEEFCELIEASGGLTQGIDDETGDEMDGTYAPAADPTWADLGAFYLTVCKKLKRNPEYANTGPFECYLLVRECRSGEEWVTEIKGRMLLDLETRVKAWVKAEFGGELKLSGELMPRLSGDYYAVIITDWRPRDSVVVWQSGGFFLQ